MAATFDRPAREVDIVAKTAAIQRMDARGFAFDQLGNARYSGCPWLV
jgi:hypothetical protein